MDTFGNRPGRDCVHKYLQAQWRILKSDYTIQPPPPGSVVQHAWHELDQAFSSTEVATQVRDVLLRLMNPPYGYHFHQLSLLFSAWYGYHRKYLEFSIDGKLDSLLSVWNLQKVDRSERFIERMVYTHHVAIKRRDVDREREKVQRMVRTILSRTEYLSQQEAEEALSLLRSALENLEDDEGLRENIQRSVQMLEEDIGIALRYDQRAEHLLKMAQLESGLRPLAEAYSKPGLPSLGIVLPSSPSVQDIQSRLMERFRQRVEAICSEAEQLRRLEDVSKYEDGLRAIIPYIRLTKNQGLEHRVKQAIRNVQERAEQLRQEAAEESLISEMRMMDTGARLATLRDYVKRLQQMNLQSAKAQEIYRQKRNQIEEAIQQSESRLRQWREAFVKAEDRAALEHLQEQTNRYWTHYEGTDEEQQVKQLVEECQQVMTLLRQVSEVANSSPPDPAGVKEAKWELEELRQQSQHPAVHKAVEQARRRLEEYAQKKVEEASHWLQQLEQRAISQQGEGLSTLLQQLSQPPAFLPEEQKPNLESLKAEVQRRIDEDAVENVRSRLRQIRDVQKLRQLREEIDHRLRELESLRG
ncbi:MAG: hypothetical protein KatS3mg022_2945 [Armatimonadota bacterium]|nr:MAG: hypothetical protein KatS3mg022_2945 [Armatimonadota bacterium]